MSLRVLLFCSSWLLLSQVAHAQGRINTEVSTTQAVAGADNRASIETIRDVRRAVVRIRTGGATGAGFLVYSNTYVATAYHVIKTGRPIKITFFEGQERSATVVAINRKYDIALLELDSPIDGLQPLPIAHEDLIVGESVFVIGHPLSRTGSSSFLKGLLDWSVSQGTISNLSPYVIQTDAATNPGNSGGPVFSSKGEVIGVVSRKATSADGIGFAMRAPLLDALYGDIGKQRTFYGEREFDPSVGLYSELTSSDTFAGLSAGFVTRRNDRFGVELLFGTATSILGSLPGDGAFQRSVRRTTLEAEASYQFLLQRGDNNFRFIVGGGVARVRDETTETTLVLQLADPACDPNAQACEVATSAVSEKSEDKRVLPVLSASIPVLSKSLLSYSFYLDTNDLGNSSHRFLLLFRF